MDLNDLAALIVQDTLATGGSSRDMHGNAPTSGYMVGGVLEPDEVVYLPDAVQFPDTLHADVLSVLTSFPLKEGDYLGVWLDKDGTAVIEVSERFEDRNDALRAGWALFEEAIYDVAAGESIQV